MISLLRESFLIKFIWGALALYLFNISVDVADPNPSYIPENLNVNEQESIIEIIVEQFLGFDSAFVEFDDTDSEDDEKKSSCKVQLVFLAAHKLPVFTNHIQETSRSIFSYNAFLVKRSQDIESPPPNNLI